MSGSDNDEGYAIAPTDIEERGNPISDDGDGRSICTNGKLQTHESKTGKSVGHNTAKISGVVSNKYRVLSPSSGRWNARVWNRTKMKKWINFRSFPTA